MGHLTRDTLTEVACGEQTLRAAFGVGAVGFILARWLLSVCNLPGVCGWLSGTSALLAVVCIVVHLASATQLRSAVLGRSVSRLLVLTCALSLVDYVLGVAAPGRFWWQAGFVEAVDLLAWVWFVCGGLMATRWLWGGLPPARTGSVGVRQLLISALIFLVIGLQVRVLFMTRPVMWPFIDYPLYSAAHGTPIRAVHHRLYGLTSQEPVAFIEITADGLGASWFVHHTQVIPQLFNRPSGVIEEFQRTLANSDFPPLQLIVPERTTFVLVSSGLEEFAERRVVRLASDPDRSAEARSR